MLALYIVLGVLASIIIGHFVTVYFLFKKFFGRISNKKIDKSISSTDYSAPYRDELFKIRDEMLKSNYEIVETTSYDKIKLKAYYFNNNSDKTLIMCHGFHTHAFINFGYAIKYFLKRHYNLLVISERAHDISEGKYSTYGQKESKDILSWIDYVAKDETIKSIYLYGISMGATSIAYASPDIKEKKVKCLVLEGIFTSVDKLLNHLVSSKFLRVFLSKSGVGFLSTHLAGVKWNAPDTVDALKKNKIPTIFVHGTKDIVAIKDFFDDNYNNCLSNKYQIIVEGAPHALCAMHEKDKYLDKLETILGENNG